MKSGDHCIVRKRGMDINVPIEDGTEVVIVGDVMQPHGCRIPSYATVRPLSGGIGVLLHVASLIPKET